MSQYFMCVYALHYDAENYYIVDAELLTILKSFAVLQAVVEDATGDDNDFTLENSLFLILVNAAMT